jgi:hypothetical protein
MLSNEDIISLGKPGTYEITINYEEVQTTVEIELLPNEVAIESLKQDVVVYCLTKKVNDVYQSVFYALGNKDFSGLQFKLSVGNKVGYVKVLSKNSNLVINEETLVVTFVNSENVKGTVELFTLEFSSSQQYRNFTMDYDLDSKIVYINPSKEVQAALKDYNVVKFKAEKLSSPALKEILDKYDIKGLPSFVVLDWRRK